MISARTLRKPSNLRSNRCLAVQKVRKYAFLYASVYPIVCFQCFSGRLRPALAGLFFVLQKKSAGLGQAKIFIEISEACCKYQKYVVEYILEFLRIYLDMSVCLCLRGRVRAGATLKARHSKLRDFIERMLHKIRNEPNFKAFFSAPAPSGAPRALSQAERVRLRNRHNRFFFLFSRWPCFSWSLFSILRCTVNCLSAT